MPSSVRRKQVEKLKGALYLEESIGRLEVQQTHPKLYFETVLVTSVSQKTEVAHEIKRKQCERSKTGFRITC
jgi:hypothetical protein